MATRITSRLAFQFLTRTLPTALLLTVVSMTRADDKPVTLKHAFKTGVTVHFASKMVAQVGETEATITRSASQTVKEVKPTGEAVLENTDEGGTASYGGQDRDIPGGTVTTLTLDKDGHIADFKTDGGGMAVASVETQTLIAYAYHILLPTKAVAPGDSWETTLDNPAAKGKKLTLKTTFVGLDKVEGADVWKLKQTVDADIDNAEGKAKFESTTWLDPTNGMEVKSTSSAKNLPTNFGVMSWTVTTTRKADTKKATTL